jgi:hypothetical protein
MTALAVAISLMLLSACERNGGNPPKPVTSALAVPVVA